MREHRAKVIMDSDKGTMEINGRLVSMEHQTTPFSQRWNIEIVTPNNSDELIRPSFLRTPICDPIYKPRKKTDESNKKEDDTMTIERIKTQKMSAEEFEESNDTFDEMTIWLNVDKVDKFKAKYGMKLEYKYNFYDDIVEISPSAFKIRGIVIPKDFVEIIEVKEKVGA